MPKYLFYFEKAEPVRWLGHLDILRAFERAVRRAELPIAFSLGFNPRVKLNFASALSTGITGSAEPAVVELVDSCPPELVEQRLNSVLPPGIRAFGCVEIPDAGRRDLLNSYDKAEYRIICSYAGDASDDYIGAATKELLSESELTITREREGRIKSINIRPMIVELSYVERDPTNGRLTWNTVVSIGESGNVKPADLTGVLAQKLPELSLRRAHRVRLLTSIEANELRTDLEPVLT